MDINKINEMVNEIDWKNYYTAHGNASGTEPARHFSLAEKILSLIICNEYRIYKIHNKYTVNVPEKLIELFSDNIETALNAASELENTLCHQRIMISTAALPAYDIIMLRLKEFEPGNTSELLESIMDIFYGFTVCTNEINIKDEWIKEIRNKLKSDIKIFEKFSHSENECISEFAQKNMRVFKK